MELTPAFGVALGVLVILLICAIGYGAFLGWNASVRRFGKNAKNMQAEFDKLDTIAQRDPARLGIDIGKQYAARKMQDTLDQLNRETDS